LTPDPDLPVLIKQARPWWLLPAVIWAAVIFVIISMPPDHIPRTPVLLLPHADKAIHFILFAIFGGLLVWGMGKRAMNGRMEARHILIALLTGTMYGVLTEYYQHCCLPERHGNIPDIIANIFGTVFGVALVAMALFPGAKKDHQQK